jgi:type II secretory pathway component PulF
MALGHVPLIGSVMMKASLARFTRMFYMMTTSGVGILQSLDLARGAVDNAVLQRAVVRMHNQVEQGKSMGDALRESTGLPPAFVEMMSLAEETGRMDELLPALEITLRKDLGRTARRVTAIIEPILTGVMGIIVLGVLLAFFIPYLEGVASLSNPSL